MICSKEELKEKILRNKTVVPVIITAEFTTSENWTDEEYVVYLERWRSFILDLLTHPDEKCTPLNKGNVMTIINKTRIYEFLDSAEASGVYYEGKEKQIIGFNTTMLSNNKALGLLDLFLFET